MFSEILPLLIAVSKRNLHERYYRIIALLDPLELQHVVVGATDPIRKVPANQRSRVIDRALARGGIKEFARFAENRVGLSPQYLLALPGGCEFSLSRFNVNAEVARQAFDVALCHLHSIVDRTAVRRTFRAVVITSFGFARSHPPVRHYRLFDF
jgi:hypothetical protein